MKGNRSAWKLPLCFVPFVLLTLLHASTYIHSLVIRHDSSTDDSVVASHGKIVITERIVPADRAPQSTVTDALLIAKGQAGLFPQPIPFRKSGGLRVVPMLPFVAASMLPPLFVIRWYDRRRWWRHIAPAVPFLSLAIAMNGRWIRQLGEQGWGHGVANLGTLVEALGIFAFVAISVTWAVCLPRNIKDHRLARGVKESRCSCCGYNLTGNVSGVCPECGEPTPSAS